MDRAPSLQGTAQGSDATYASDRLMLAQRDADRLRRLLRETEDDHRRELEQLAQEKAQAETLAIQRKVERDDAEKRREEAVKAAADAAAEQRRHSQRLSDVRKQVDQRVTTLVERLHQKDGEIHTLQYKCRSLAEKLTQVSALEEQLRLKDSSMQQLEAQLDAARRGTASLEREREDWHQERARLASVAPSHAAGRAPSVLDPRQGSLLRLPAGGSPGAASALAGDVDPHVAETAQLAAVTKDWLAQAARDVESLEDSVELELDQLLDLKLLLDKGGQMGRDAVQAAQADRQRAAQLRQTERERQAQHTNQLRETATTATVVKAEMGNVRFNMGKVKHTLALIRDHHGSLRALVERACGQVGINAMSTAWSKQRPQPIPMPDYTPLESPSAARTRPARGGAASTPPASPLSPASDGAITAADAFDGAAAAAAAATVAAHAAQLESAEQQLRQSSVKLVEAEQRAVKAEGERDDARRRIDALDRDLALAEQRLSMAKDDAARATDRSRDDAGHMSEVVAGLRRELEEEREGRRAERRAADESVSDVQQQWRRDVREATEARDEEASRQRQVAAQLNREVEELTSRAADLAAAADAGKMKQASLRAERDAARQETEDLSQLVDRLTSQLAEAQRIADQFGAEAEAAHRALAFEEEQQEQALLQFAAQNSDHPAASALATPRGRRTPTATVGRARSPKVGHGSVAGSLSDISAGPRPRPGGVAGGGAVPVSAVTGAKAASVTADAFGRWKRDHSAHSAAQRREAAAPVLVGRAAAPKLPNRPM